MIQNLFINNNFFPIHRGILLTVEVQVVQFDLKLKLNLTFLYLLLC